MHGILTPFVYPLLLASILSLLIFVHELGHFIVARLCGVEVAAFALGFGRELVGWTDRCGIRWKLCLLPFGGYVRMAGADAPPRIPPQRRFATSSLPVRAAITIGGPLANFLFAVWLLALLYAVWGQNARSPELTMVQPDTPAARAGLQPGDLILTIDGYRMERYEDIGRFIHRHPGDTLEIVLRRADETKTVEVVPEVAGYIDEGGKPATHVRIGIVDTAPRIMVRLPPLEALSRGADGVADMVKTSLYGLYQLADGQRPSDQMGGAGSMVQEAHASVAVGLDRLVWLSAMLSVSIGLFNLFPIPILDGGHLVLFALEAVRSRPLTPRGMVMATYIGIGMILVLALLAARNDLMHSAAAAFMQRRL